MRRSIRKHFATNSAIQVWICRVWTICPFPKDKAQNNHRWNHCVLHRCTRIRLLDQHYVRVASCTTNKRKHAETDDDTPDEDESYKWKHVETDDDTPDEDETYKRKHVETDDDTRDENESYKRKHMELDDDTPDEDESYKR